MGRSTRDILRGLTLPLEGEEVEAVGAAQINVNDAWRAFISKYGQADDAARFVRGPSIPIGGPVTVTVGLETLLGMSGGGGGGNVQTSVLEFNLGTIPGGGESDIITADLDPVPAANRVIRIHSGRLAGTANGPVATGDGTPFCVITAGIWHPQLIWTLPLHTHRHFATPSNVLHYQNDSAGTAGNRRANAYAIASPAMPYAWAVGVDMDPARINGFGIIGTRLGLHVQNLTSRSLEGVAARFVQETVTISAQEPL